VEVVVSGGSSQDKRRRLVLGGIVYEIIVTPFDDVYRAVWSCTQCGETGSWAPVSATPDRAIELAELAIGVHQTLVHGEATGSLKGTRRLR
jgi:hypothetical protein